MPTSRLLVGQQTWPNIDNNNVNCTFLYSRPPEFTVNSWLLFPMILLNLTKKSHLSLQGFSCECELRMNISAFSHVLFCHMFIKLIFLQKWMFVAFINTQYEINDKRVKYWRILPLFDLVLKCVFIIFNFFILFLTKIKWHALKWDCLWSGILL